MTRHKSLHLKCHSCGSMSSPHNPVVWWGIPTYCVPCFNRIRKGDWKGIMYYEETGEEYPK